MQFSLIILSDKREHKSNVAKTENQVVCLTIIFIYIYFYIYTALLWHCH